MISAYLAGVLASNLKASTQHVVVNLQLEVGDLGVKPVAQLVAQDGYIYMTHHS